jgi:hypothetical protein
MLFSILTPFQRSVARDGSRTHYDLTSVVLQISKTVRAGISPASQSGEKVIATGLTYKKSDPKVALPELSDLPNYLPPRDT